ncbi:MAG TPA: FtsX-like permease family protein [Dyella sp.]|uniref:ABC transporter permease n=1 Tax=Dyella sp. TaxID=1869338 RepID=UPI002C1A3E24|nr:FtsX-like permease family protein [Dyella sp.]HUB91222.1 FtsX-like permease family protein [Dyella sp.]
MDIRPIFVSLYKHLTPALLIVMEIALSYAVLCNALFMINGRVAAMHVQNAIGESAISVITMQGLDAAQLRADIPRNLVALQGIAGVSAAAVTTSVPLDGQVAMMAFTARPAEKNSVNSSEYFLGEGGEKALGLRLLQGRFFNESEYASSGRQDFLSTGHVVLITQSDAQRLWPGESPLGKLLYSDSSNWTVVGVVADVLGQDPAVSGENGRYSSAFFPLQTDDALNDYVIYSAPAERARIVREALRVIGKLEPTAIIDGKPYEEIRSDYFATSRSMVWILALVCAVMLAVNAFGVIGLTSFWVAQRYRQIGIRRAVGASRRHIFMYFQTENLLLSGMGAVLGMTLAYGINIYLMHHYEVERMPWYYLLLGMIALLLLGQLAVLGPTLRASLIPPLAAMRR